MHCTVRAHQIVGRVDQREMREGLRKIAQLPLGGRVVFLGQKSYVVAHGQKSFK